MSMDFRRRARGLRFVLFCFCSLTCVLAGAGGDTVLSIEKALVERWEGVTSLTADLVVEAEYSFSANVPPAHVTGRGTAEYLKKTGGDLSRLELALDLTDTIRLASFVGVCDGKDAYVTRELMGQVSSEKVSGDTKVGIVPPGGRAFFEALHKEFQVKAQPSETLNEQEVYVLDAQAKNPVGEFKLSKMRLYFSKETGVIAKVAVWNEQGVLLGTITTHNVKLNVPIDESRFNYVPVPTTSAGTFSGFQLPQLAFPR